MKLATWIRGGSFIAGVLGLLSLLASIVHSFETLHLLKEALGLYAEHVRDPVLRALNIDSASHVVTLDVLVLWISTFLAVNAFVYQCDGTFLWRHIGENYCFRSKQSFIAQFACRLPKFIWAFVMTPIVCVLAVWTTARTGHTHLRMAYLTIEPRAVARYLLGLIVVPTLLLAIAAAVQLK